MQITNWPQTSSVPPIIYFEIEEAVRTATIAEKVFETDRVAIIGRGGEHFAVVQEGQGVNCDVKKIASLADWWDYSWNEVN